MAGIEVATGELTAKEYAGTEIWTNENKILHILRNPYGFTEDEIRAARLEACNLIERYKDAYRNMKEWAEKNGVDTMAYHQG